MNILNTYQTVTELLQKLESVSEATNDCARNNQDELLSLRKDEILMGRDSDGNPFRPTYRSDPYFKNLLSADRYANWKERLEIIHNARIAHELSYPAKDNDTPNLRLTTVNWAPGRNFQDSMFINIGGDSLIIGSTYRDATMINAKYKNKVYDLGPAAKEYFWKWILYPYLYMYIWD